MTDASFYITGGTLPQNASSYIKRQADTDLRESLLRGEYCFVLNTRQMGKSSLMVRTAGHLRGQGVTCAVLDLTAIGQNLSPDQWYDGLLASLAEQLRLEDELEDFWQDNARLGPMQRFVAAIRQVALPNLTRREQGTGNREQERDGGFFADAHAPHPTPDASLVIFVDEIDAVRSLPFPADEFFAGIRECYNRRTEDPEMARLTFCLLGVATPADLIADTRMSPFNIGRRIVLTDFTPQEAAPLAQGIRGGSPVLRRVLHWTSGHPYMTQRLCRAIAEAPETMTPRVVDRLCETLFLSKTARETDDNLAFVRNRLLRSEVDLAALLDLYQQLRNGKSVPDDETNPLCGVLRLSGVAKAEKGLLTVRNRIYDRVFDKAWVRANMPDAERRRQRQAYQRGLVRALTLGGAVVGVVAGLAVYSGVQADRANRNARLAGINEAKERTAHEQADKNAAEANQQRQAAERAGVRANAKAQEAAENLLLANHRLTEATTARTAESTAKREALAKAALARAASEEAHRRADALERTTYNARLNLVQSEWERNNIGHVISLLHETRRSRYRGFEWGYWNRTSHAYKVLMKGHIGYILGIAASPDGKYIVTGSGDRTAKIWNAASGQEIRTLRGHTKRITSVDISPDGTRIATASEDNTAKIWDFATGHELFTLKGHRAHVFRVAFSPDSKRIVTASEDRTAKVWDGKTGHDLLTLTGHTQIVTCAAFSQDGAKIVTAGFDKTVRVWDAQTGRILLTLTAPESFLEQQFLAAAFSPDGRRIVTGSESKIARVWDAATGREVMQLAGHTSFLTAAVYSPDGRYLLTASGDGTARLWDAATGRQVRILQGHTSGVPSAAFLPDGKHVVTGCYDGTARIWQITTPETRSLSTDGSQLVSVAFTPDGKRILTATFKHIVVHDSDSGRELLTMSEPKGGFSVAQFSPDGRRIVAGVWDGVEHVVRVYNSVNGRVLLTLKGHNSKITAVSCSANGKLIATASWDYTAKVWEAATGKLVRTFRGHLEPISSVSLSPDGSRLVTCTGLPKNGVYADTTTRVWSVATGEPLFIFRNRSNEPFLCATFSPDGTRIAAGNGVVANAGSVWDATTGHEVCSLTGHVRGISSIAFSPDGTRILTGCEDGTIKCWDAMTGDEMLTLKGHKELVSSVAFSPDSTRIVTGGWDSSALVWTSEPHEFEEKSSVVDARIAAEARLRRNVLEQAARRGRERFHAALARATANHCNVLLVFGNGTDNDIYTNALRKSFSSASLAPILARNYVVVSMEGIPPVETDKPDYVDGSDYLSRYNGLGHTPFMAIVDGRGRKLVDSFDRRNSEHGVSIGMPESPAEIEWFLMMLRRTGPRLTETDLATIRSYFEKRAATQTVNSFRRVSLENLIFFEHAPAKARFSTEGKAARIEVLKKGDAIWKVQGMFLPRNIREGGRYTVTFRARADRPLPVDLVAETEGEGYRNIGLKENLALTPEWKTFRFSFTAQQIAAVNRVPTFNFGENEGIVWIAEVKVTEEKK